MDAGRVVSARSLIERLWPDERPDGRRRTRSSRWCRGCGSRSGRRDCRTGYSSRRPSATGWPRRRRRWTPLPSRTRPARDVRPWRAATRRPPRACSARRSPRWRGPALADVAGEEFAAAPAARLAELRAAALLDRIEAELAVGAAGPEPIGELRELTAADPLAERPAVLLMRALAAAGRQAEALAVYQRTRDQLAEDLGVDPSAQLDQAYLAVLRQEIPVAIPARASPTDPGPDAAAPAPAAAAGVSRPASSAGTTTCVGRAEATRRRAPGHAHRTGRRRARRGWRPRRPSD